MNDIFFGCDQVKKVWETAGLWNTVHTNIQGAQSTKALISKRIDALLDDLK